jgi:o-succinylbenzoate synthase
VKLAGVEVIPYALPFREPYVTARGRLDRREMALLRLRSDEGPVGLGEAVPLSLRGGPGLAGVVEELERLEDRDPLDETTLRSSAIDLSPPARCALTTALLDLQGQRAASGGHPRAAVAEPIECNATLVAGEPAAVAADAERWAVEGFRTFKLKLGVGGDVEQVRTVREAVGAEARIRVDANAAWDVEAAKRTLAALEPFDVELAEQPVATLEEMAELMGSTLIPLAADESVESRVEADRAVELGACTLTGVKLSKVGGPEAAIEIADVLPAYMTSALDGPVGIAAAAQVAQTLRAGGGEAARLAQGLATQRLFASSIASVECELRGAMLSLPEGPGLGVEIDEAALERHRL